MRERVREIESEGKRERERLRERENQRGREMDNIITLYHYNIMCMWYGNTMFKFLQSAGSCLIVTVACVELLSRKADSPDVNLTEKTSSSSRIVSSIIGIT